MKDGGFEMQNSNLYADVAIIGGGITGIAIARELSKYKLSIVLVERGGELAVGASKATLGHIYTGLNMVGSMILKSVVLPKGTPFTVEALHDSNALVNKWTDKGFYEWPKLLDDLDVRYKYSHLLVVAENKNQIEDLEKYVLLGKSAGGVYGNFKKLKRKEIFEIEPNLNKNIQTALYAEKQIIDIFPPELVLSLAENAVENGVRILLNTEAIKIIKEQNFQFLKTSKNIIKTKYIINAAGGWADKVSDLAGERNWGLKYNKTQIIILDRKLNSMLNGTVRWPNKPGEINLVQRRSDNILIECGTYDSTNNPSDTGNTREGIQKGIKIAQTLLPVISEKDIISTFTGVRVFNTRNPGDHIIEFSEDNDRFLNVLIRLPGIIGALPMSRHVVSMLENKGLKLVPKENFVKKRKAIPRIGELSLSECNDLVKENWKYGKFICKCEKVTQGEIEEAIKRGACTIDGVKFRTRASMGKCQGNFCGFKIAEIIAEKLKIKMEKVTKNGIRSTICK